MKYKYCPDCGSKMTHSRSSCGWAESYNCDMGCHLQIEIRHGETMHAAPDEEKWIRKQPEQRKPREWIVCVDANRHLQCQGNMFYGDNYFKVREVIE